MHGIRQRHTNYSGCTKEMPLELERKRSPPSKLGEASAGGTSSSNSVCVICSLYFSDQFCSD